MTPGEPRASPESLESLPAPIDTASTGSCATEPEAAEQAIQAKLAEARARLERRAGTAPSRRAHYHRPPERPFTAEDRDRVTILISGLTTRHEHLIQAALEAAGYRCQPLPVPDLTSCLVGKQYGNNGLCNPAYFTVGNLVKHRCRNSKRPGSPAATSWTATPSSPRAAAARAASACTRPSSSSRSATPGSTASAS